MRQILSAILPLIAVSVFIIVSCQSVPVTLPGDNPGFTGEVARDISSGESSHHCLGYYSMVVDTAENTVEFIPMREAALHFNLTGIFNSTNGLHVAGVPGQHDPAHGIFTFDITLTHPFPTKQQFCGFDVKGILLTPGTLEVGPLRFADVEETRLLNKDGYTRWWNPSEFLSPGVFGYIQGKLANGNASTLTATVNPYKLFADILGPEDSVATAFTEPLGNSQGRAVFTAGSSNTRRYRIRFPYQPSLKVVYGYAIDASWKKPSPNPPSEIPDDFPMDANQPEACAIDIIEVVNTLWHDTYVSSYHGGVLRIAAGIRDWQGVQPGTIHDQIEAVRVYAPGLFDGGQTMNFFLETAGRAYYSIDLWGIADPTFPGDWSVIVRAESKNGPAFNQGVSNAPTVPVSAFNLIDVRVVDPDCESDTNNDIATAEDIGLNDMATSLLCPQLDQSDWYRIEIPVGYDCSEEIRYIHDTVNQGSNGLILHDSYGDVVATSSSYSGYNIIDVGSYNLHPGIYYIEVRANEDTPPFKYLLETSLDCIDLSPDNPVEIPNDYQDCSINFISTDRVNSGYLYGSGPGGTFSFTQGVDYEKVLGRTYDTIGIRPAFKYSHMFYVESYSDNPAGIDHVDFTVDSAPVHTEDVLTINGNVRAMTMSAGNLYVAYGTGAASSINVYWFPDDWNHPALIKTFTGPDYIQRLDICEPLYSEKGLIAMGLYETSAYNVQDPENPYLLNTKPMAGDNFLIDLDTDQNKVVVTLANPNDNSARLQLYTYDDSIGLTAVAYGVLNDGGGGCVAVNGNFAFVENTNNTISSFDLTSSPNLDFLDIIAVAGIPLCLDARGFFLAVAVLGDGLSLIDIGNPTLMQELYKGYCVNYPVGGYSNNDFYYLIESTTDYGALSTVRESDPDVFSLWGKKYLNGQPTCMAGSENYLIAGGLGDNKVWVFELEDPYNPTYSWTKTYNSHVTSVALNGNLAYVALQNGIMKILDISNLPMVTELPDESFPGELYNMQITGDYLYASFENKLPFFEIITPDNLSFYGNLVYGGSDFIRDFTIQGDYLYLTTGNEMHVIDISENTAPDIQGSVALPYAPNMRHIKSDGFFNYLCDATHMPVVVSPWPSESPSVWGEPFDDTYNYTLNSIFGSGNRMFCLFDQIGLRIFELY